MAAYQYKRHASTLHAEGSTRCCPLAERADMQDDKLVTPAAMQSHEITLQYVSLCHRTGENFSYGEAQEVPNAVVAYLGSLVFAVGYLIISLRFLRPLVMRLLPKPGEGPTKKQQVEGFWCALPPPPVPFQD